MLSRQHSQVASTINRSPSHTHDIPEYFTISTEYDVIPVGHKFNTFKIANEGGYDCYILAGIEENELFSKLLMMNMNVTKGIAFDSNIHKISQYFPDDIKVINKQISYKKDQYFENLSEVGEEKDIFLKMNIYGDEYLWVLSLPEETQQKFKQMVIVFHDINNNSTQQRAMNKINCFQKLKKTHDIVNITPVGQNIIITYFRKGSRSDDTIASSHISQELAEEDDNTTNFYKSDDDVEIENVRPVIDSDDKQHIISKIQKIHDSALEKVHAIIKEEQIKNEINLVFGDLLRDITSELKKKNNFDDKEQIQERIQKLSQQVDSVIESTTHNTEDTIENKETQETEEQPSIENDETEQEIEHSVEDTNQVDGPTFSEKPKSKNAKRAAKQRAAKKAIKFDDIKVDEEDVNVTTDMEITTEDKSE